MTPARVPRHFGPFAFYIIGVAALFPFYAHMIDPDTISYVSIARHYIAGDWREAVNTNWSPMFSWLMIPLLGLHTPGLDASRVICFLSGLLTLYAVLLLGRGFELRNGVLTVTLYTAAAMTVAFALLREEPDLLEGALLLFYFRLIFDREYSSARRWSGVWCGALGGLAFLTKSYALYFFLGHFTLMTLFQALQGPKDRRKSIAAHFAQGLAVFLLIATPWIGLISGKLGRFTVGTTRDFDYRLVGPDSPGYPQYYSLIPPPGAHALSMWEEPATQLLPRWSPLHSGRELRHELKLVAINLRVLIRLLVYTSLLSIPIVLLYAIDGCRAGAHARYHWLPPVLTVAMLPAGYLLVNVQDRYLWSIVLLILRNGSGQRFAATLAGSAWTVRAGGGPVLFCRLLSAASSADAGGAAAQRRRSFPARRTAPAEGASTRQIGVLRKLEELAVYRLLSGFTILRFNRRDSGRGSDRA